MPDGTTMGGDSQRYWFDLSHAQRARWFMYQWAPQRQGQHNNVFAARLHGSIDVEELSRALIALATRHSMLRARFREDSGQPLQSVDFIADVPFDCIDATGWSGEDLVRRVRDDALRPFDVVHSPPLRAVLYTCGEDEAVFCLAADHLVLDGWAYWRLLAELGDHLNGCAETSALALDYADYVTAQQRWLEGPEALGQLNYWRQALAGPLPALDVSFAQPTGGGQERQRFAQILVPASCTERLHTLAVAHGGTLFTCLLAAFQILLHRYSGQDDIVVGCPMPARGMGEWDQVVGDFVNVIGLRARFEGAPGLGEALRQARTAAFQGMSRQDYPFAALVEQLHIPRGATHPVFQALFSLQRARADGGIHRLWATRDDPAARPRWAQASLSPFPMHQHVGIEGIAISLQALELDEGIRCEFGFDAGQLDAAVMADFASSFGGLLEAMTDAAPAMAVASLPILPPGQSERLVDSFNQTRRDYPDARCVHALFEAQVAARPQAVALVEGTQVLRYGELNAQANRLAHYLIGQGVRPDDRVGVCLERGIALVVALLGILKAGGAYVPLDPGYPPDRLGYMLADSAPRCVLTQAAVQTVLPASVPVIALDQAGLLDGQPVHDPDPQALGLTPQHLAYVIYTSGSTGRPKGVMNQHDGVVNRLLWAQEQFALDASDRVLQKTPFGFDVSVWEFFLPLLAGAQLVLARPGGHQDPHYLAGLMASAGITVLHFVPSMLQVFLDEADTSGCGGVRQILCSGEALPAALQDRLLERLPQVALYNLYGPTEAAVDVTCWRCQPGSATVPIGRPIANTQIHIVDRYLQPVPIGVAGELLIGGVQVARGYLNQPQLTAERFIEDPFHPGGRVYRSGDLARWRQDGTIDYLGRNDDQVKLRGQRIELGEVQSQLQQLPHVRDAVVVAREDRAGDPRLVAYVVTVPGVELTVSTVREALARTLTEAMLPSAVVSLPALPLTPNGKLDRQALPVPGMESLAARAYEPPREGMEQALAQLWCELLDVARVGRADHFFDLGGNSLIAVRLVARIRQWGCPGVSLRDLFAHPRLDDMASLLADGPAEAAVITRRDQQVPLSLTPAQKRLWFLDQLDKVASTAYHMPARLMMTGPLDHAALRRSLDTLVARHEVLRTRFIRGGDAPVPVVAPAATGFVLSEHTVPAGNAHVRDAAIAEWSRREALAPFDLAGGPLIRGCLLQLRADQHLLLVTQHHIISDGWSVGILVRELMALYAAFTEARDNPLPPPLLQYADYAAWLRDQVPPGQAEQQAAYWQGQLAGAPALLALPSDRPRPPVQSHAGASVALRLPPSVVEGLRHLAQRNDATLFMTLLAAWSVLLSRLSGQPDVVVGTPVANRPRREWEPVVGLFVNTVPLRIRADGALRVTELLAQAKDVVLDAFANDALPFDQLVEAVRPVRSLGHNPVFQTLLALDNTPSIRMELAGLDVVELATIRHRTQFDLSLSLSERDGALHGWLEYSSDLFDESTIQRWSVHLQTLLAAMAGQGDTTVDQLPLQSRHEQRDMHATFNATQAPAGEGALHHEFERQAAHAGSAIALLSDAGAMRYDTLNRRSNQLAHYLIALGVGPEARVAIYMNRGVDLVVALLAVLKAGGAYVPLDPRYPPDRLAYMLSDSTPHCILSERALCGLLPEHPASVVCVDTPGLLDGHLETNPDHAAVGLKASHLAYVIYTSGSTGRPKGVMIQHANAGNFVAWGLRSFPRDVLERTLFSTSINFDLAVFELFVPLSAGTTVVLVEDLVSAGPLLGHATLINTVPSAIDAVLERGETLRGVIQINLAGEPLKRALVERIFSRTGVRGVANLYGPSETTTYSTWVAMSREQGFQAHIGAPVANTQIHIVDTLMRPVPIGVTGEILIGGLGVCRGYLGQPALTAQRFLEDATDGRLYRTGDLGRWRPDGNIEYLGRNDFQVKVRGFRIELGEVEAQLARLAGVRDAVVVARDDPAGQQRLVAYVVGVDASAPSVPTLRKALSGSLPEYMVPAAFVILPSLPLTPNGKLDRHALPEPARSALAANSYEAPQGLLETTLSSIWSELLGVAQVGRYDHFFELGGHSLNALALASRLQRELQVEVPVKEIFHQPTLAALAEWIQRQRHCVARPVPPPLRRASHADEVPLSFAQQRLWLDHWLNPASPAYNMSAALRIRGAFDVQAFSKAIALLFARHEALRTVFALRHDRPVQRVLATPDHALVFKDLSTVPAGERERLAQAAANEEASTPFQLSTGPLFRVRLLRLDACEHVALLTAHHIICDGWSIQLMQAEIGRIYQALASGEVPDLLDLPVQYADYAQWQRETMRGQYLRDRLDYWRGALAGSHARHELATDHPRVDGSAARGDYRTFPLSHDQVRGLRALARQEGATLFMTVLAGFQMLLAQRTGADDIVVGSAISGRGPVEVEHLIGCFVNMLVLRTDLSGDPLFRQLLARVRQTTVAAFAHQELPFDVLVDELKPERLPGRTPFFQVAFGLQPQLPLSMDAADLELSVYAMQNDTARYDLTVWVYEGEDTLDIKWTYRSDLFEPATIERLHADYMTLLDSVIIDPDQRLSSLLPALEGRMSAAMPGQSDTARTGKGGQFSARRKAIMVPAHERGTSL